MNGTIIIGLGWLLGALAAHAVEQWTLEKPEIWARDAKTVMIARQDVGWQVTHTGTNDWSLAGILRIAVTPG